VWPVKYLLHGPLVIRHSHSANIRAIRGRLSPLNSCLLVFIRVHSWLAELSENRGRRSRAAGSSETEGKAARASGERVGKRASFNSAKDARFIACTSKLLHASTDEL